MSFQTNIPCPDCGSNILIDSTLLLSGEKFACTNEACSAVLSLDESSISQVKDAFEKYEDLKRKSQESAS